MSPTSNLVQHKGSATPWAPLLLSKRWKQLYTMTVILKQVSKHMGINTFWTLLFHCLETRQTALSSALLADGNVRL